MYSAFVLTSVGTEYYIKDIARVFEYYVYFWGAGDFIEELISCFVSVKKVFVYFFLKKCHNLDLTNSHLKDMPKEYNTLLYYQAQPRGLQRKLVQ